MSKDTARKKIGQDFQCPIVYQNKLPPLPFEPKLLEQRGQLERHYRDPLGSIHSSTPLPLHGKDLDNGLRPSPISLGLIWGEKQIRGPAKLDEEDQLLLAPYSEPKKISAVQVARPVASWLRRTAEQRHVESNYKSAPSRPKAEVLPMKEAKSVSSILKAIDHTFEVAARFDLTNIRHPTNPSLKAKEMLPLYPDFEHWPNRYRLAVFDADPLRQSTLREKGQNEDELSRIPYDVAILKAQRNPKDPTDTFLSYYSPSEATAKRIFELRLEGLEDDDSELYEYRHVRDFDVKRQSADDAPLVFVDIREEEGAAFYHRLGDRMTLTRKRSHAARRDEEEELETVTQYNLRKRPFTKEEERMRGNKTREILTRGELPLEPEM
ncbi:RNA polymerase II-associated [Zopfochytrium polystomum]|nr:RNA polymerase II-associated [Zopfochytrium polystomum]